MRHSQSRMLRSPVKVFQHSYNGRQNPACLPKIGEAVCFEQVKPVRNVHFDLKLVDIGYGKECAIFNFGIFSTDVNQIS